MRLLIDREPSSRARRGRAAALPPALLLGFGALAAACLLVPACAPGSDVPADRDAGAGGALFGGGGPGAGDDGGLTEDSACDAIKLAANASPLNLYVMFDKSQSMVGDKWTSAKAGLSAFVNSPVAVGVRVGLRFFPRDPDATPACDQNAYKEPQVPFGDLPTNAQAILDGMNAESPDGFNTPMYPALGGAILKGIQLAENAPGETSAVLLVTDGAPQGPAPMCSGVDPADPAVIAALAEVGASHDPPVYTYVIGLPGVDQATANLIASKGGSTKAILVGATNVEAEFEQALSAVLGQALPCEYEIPDKVSNGEFQLDAVNVEITPGGGDPTIVPENPSCDGAGWHYDDGANPQLIVLCPDTCQAVKSDYEAKIKILLGCHTLIK